eukprot:GHVT01090174.1.p1 GENE.GHVT01090174.1~~GHVT01090174.1.p1  ORF type:complete len:453 (+),score=36.71 GHVT01090174.1:335-1693(+)
MTDRLQGVLLALLIVVVCVSSAAVANFSHGNWKKANHISNRAFVAGSVILSSMWSCFMNDQSLWQRVIAARSNSDVRWSTLSAATLSFLTVFLFGALGVMCRAHYPDASSDGILLKLLLQQDHGWLVLVGLLGVTSCTSTVDTYQNALASVAGFELLRSGKSFNWARALTLLLNVPIVALAAVPTLPLMALYMALNIFPVITAPTLVFVAYPSVSFWAVVASVVSSMIAIMTIAWSSVGNFIGGMKLIISGDYESPAYLAIFVGTPIAGFVSLGLVSWIERRWGMKCKGTLCAKSAAVGAENTKNSELSLNCSTDNPQSNSHAFKLAALGVNGKAGGGGESSKPLRLQQWKVSKVPQGKMQNSSRLTRQTLRDYTNQLDKDCYVESAKEFDVASGNATCAFSDEQSDCLTTIVEERTTYVAGEQQPSPLKEPELDNSVQICIEPQRMARDAA